MRRPSHAIGAVFITSEYTQPALDLSKFIGPQTIILWEGNHINYCIENSGFIDGMTRKYRTLIEEGNPNDDITEKI